MTTDETYMELALALAQKGVGRVSPNPLVGCVIVKKKQIIGQGYHEKFGGQHAEIHALKQAGAQAKGATLYVTLEPCSHFGKTPPCVDAVIKAGIKHVVVAMKDPNPLVSGRGIKKLIQNKTKVTLGVCAQEARALNVSFIKAVTKHKPYVIAKVAQSLDGMITTQKGKQGWITGTKAKQYVQTLRSCVDAVLVGDETVRIDNPQLNVRDKNKPQPARVILDPQLKTDLKSKIFKTRGGPVILFCGLPAEHTKVKQLQNKGITVIASVPVKNNKLRLSAVLKKLYALNKHKILVEGGACVFQSFLREGLVDEWHIIVAPKIVGDNGLCWLKKRDAGKLKVVCKKKLGKDSLFVVQQT